MGNELVEEAVELAREIEQAVRDFFEQMNDLLSWVPDLLDHLVRPIQMGLDKLNRELQAFWDRVNQCWDQRGDADRLREVGEQWSAKVGAILAEIADTIGLDQLRTNIEWTGRAARAYTATVPPQGEGLKGIKDLSDQMQTSLNNLANGLDAFWMAMGFALAGFVVGLAVAIAEACSVVAAPAGIVTLLACAAAAIGLIGAAMMAFESHTNTIEAEQLAITQKAREVGERWKMPNTNDMGDASARDGDPSDWTLD